ncbi:hypothetical protein [Kutzneria sp. NPDC052558]|uniref:hypothetical protein n=1 Tax=Kutzneria sp. NPDC052558 TaxID=3364121 RepID=UPI0037C66444
MAGVTGASIMPATVAAAHLESCAAALAGARITDQDDIATIVPILTRAQRQLAVALKNISLNAVGGQPRSVTLEGRVLEWTELSEVLTEAADAADSTADALEEALPFLEDADGDDTRS